MDKQYHVIRSDNSSELYHYGVKGMKWGIRKTYARDIYRKGKKVHSKGDEADRWGVGVKTQFVRKKNNADSGGITGAIRRKQRSNIERDLADIKSKQSQVNSELRELTGYDRNSRGLAKSKISSAVRRIQIKSLNSINEKLKKLENENIDALKELDSIEKYQAKKRADKAKQKIAQAKIKDLERQYGKLEDLMTYGKNANAKDNARIEREMTSIESEINKLKNRR